MPSPEATDMPPDAAADAETEKARAMAATSLDLSFRGLQCLPREIGSVSSLQILDLSNNEITDVADTGGDGPKAEVGAVVAAAPFPAGLKVLNLSHNLVAELGDFVFANLVSLELLYLNSNRLGSLPATCFVCTNLTELSLARNQLENLPKALGESLPLLKHLDVSYNMLHSLPDSLGQLKHLEFLNARFNQLKRVPASLGGATALTHLDLSSNFVNLTSVPGSLGNLRNLTELDLSNNQIGALPVQLGRLDSLQLLLLDGNPLHFPPLELLTIEAPSIEAAQHASTTTSASSSSWSSSRKAPLGEEASRASARATTRVVRDFLAAKLREWEEEEAARTQSTGGWEAWLGEWPMLQDWVNTLYSATVGGPIGALEGAAVSAVPRAALPSTQSSLELPNAAASHSISIAVGSQVKSPSSSVSQSQSLGRSASAQVAEEEALVAGRQKWGDSVDSKQGSLHLDASNVEVPLLDREDSREACLA